MVSVSVPALRAYVTELLQAKGTPMHIAAVVAESLVLSNRRGHDSHGFIRVTPYCDWVDRGLVDPAAEPERVADDPARGAGRRPLRVGPVRRPSRHRLGDREGARRALRADHPALHAPGAHGRVHGAGGRGGAGLLLVHEHARRRLVTAPHGGCERRLSANPLAAGAPLPDGPPMMMDIATSSIAAGKVQVAVERGEALGPGHLVDGAGQPSTDPKAYAGRPDWNRAAGGAAAVRRAQGLQPGDVLRGAGRALTGAGCSTTGVQRVANGFLALFLDPAAFCGEDSYRAELGALIPQVSRHG